MAEASGLDDKGFVVDFGVLKEIVGRWIDEALDHGFIGSAVDPLVDVVSAAGWKLYLIDGEPTAENIAADIFANGSRLLAEACAGVRLAHVRVYETPNCWADFP